MGLESWMEIYVNRKCVLFFNFRINYVNNVGIEMNCYDCRYHIKDSVNGDWCKYYECSISVALKERFPCKVFVKKG